MSVDVDPTASLRGWPVVVTLGGRDYHLRPALAAEWLPILLENPIDLSLILPGMAGEADDEALEEALLAGTVSAADIGEACQEVISMAAGREWWWATNLLASVAGAWMAIFGTLVAQGLDVTRLPLGAVLDAMYATCAARMDKQHLQDFNRQLNMPPAGITPTIDEDRESANFLALMNTGV